MIRKSGTLLLVVASLAVSALVVEGSFWLFARWSEPIYPFINYMTDEPRVRLDCFDDHFVGTPDFVCGGELTYMDNGFLNPSLADLSPRKVPNAIENRHNEKRLRERPMAEFDGRRDKIVVLVGDSFCYGIGVRVEDRFSNVLETRLNREYPAEHYRLFNGCKPGWGIEHVSGKMEHFINYFARVDRVVYLFVLNDPIMRGHLWKWFKESKGITVKNGRRPRLDGEFNNLMSVFSRSNAARFLAGRDSYTLRWFAARLQRQQTAHETIEWYRQLYTNNPHWPQTRELLRGMKDYCSARGIAFSLVVWPLFYKLEAYPLTEIHEIIEVVAQQEGIHYVDLLPLFAGKDARDYWIHPTDFHPNSRAHAEAAAFLYDAIPW